MLRLFVSLGLVFFAAFNTSAGPAADADHFYVTRDDFEPDKCASIWLIKRFIDPQAVFVIRPAGAPLKPGIPFDVPEAELRRYHNRSTFEHILYIHALKDPKLEYIGKLIHDIEINTWQEKAWPQTLDLQQTLVALINGAAHAEDIVQQSLVYFDALYAKLD